MHVSTGFNHEIKLTYLVLWEGSPIVEVSYQKHGEIEYGVLSETCGAYCEFLLGRGNPVVSLPCEYQHTYKGVRKRIHTLKFLILILTVHVQTTPSLMMVKSLSLEYCILIISSHDLWISKWTYLSFLDVLAMAGSE